MENDGIQQNTALGYDEFFEAGRKELGLEGFPVARVIAEHKGMYRVKNESGEYMAKVTGKQMFNAASREDFPAVGDWVAISDASGDQAVIRGILPRKTAIKRQNNAKNEIQIIATNVDVALIVESVDRDYNLNRFERYFVLLSGEGIKPAVILNKSDLLSQGEFETKVAEIKNRLPGTDVLSSNAVTEGGLEDLQNYIEKGKTYCFLGSSGVGKSSLINKLIGEGVAKTKDISESAGRGKHTTTNREMYFLENGGIVIDNPGMREVGIAEGQETLGNVFDEISALAALCRYADCTHTHEPDCRVLEAVEAGQLDRDKYANYLKLKKETEYQELTEVGKRRRDRQFGKILKKAQADLKRYKNKY